MKVKKVLSCLLVIVMLITITPIVSFAETKPLNKLGLKPCDWNSIDGTLASGVFNASSLPKSVDLTSSFPTPGNQGSQLSCVAWAVGYALVSGQQMNKRNWSRTSSAHQFSPSFIYNQINGGYNAGSNIKDALDLVSSKGVCSLNYFPYVEKDYVSQPTAIQKAAASMYKSLSTRKIATINDIKGVLSEGDGVILGINVYSDFDNLNRNNQIYDSKLGESRGAHAICLIGYDDSKGAFKFINSWGTDWGLNGYGWISYNLVNDNEVNNLGAGHALSLFKTTSDDYILGDVDGDGKVTATDARQVLRFYAKLDSPTAMQYVLSDADGDAVITAADAQNVLKYSARQISNLPLYD